MEQSLYPNFLSRTGIDLDRLRGSLSMVFTHIFGGSQNLTKFDPAHFRDFIWRNFFAKTLPFSDFNSVTNANYRVSRLPWTMMQKDGSLTA